MTKKRIKADPINLAAVSAGPTYGTNPLKSAILSAVEAGFNASDDIYSQVFKDALDVAFEMAWIEAIRQIRKDLLVEFSTHKGIV